MEYLIEYYIKMTENRWPNLTVQGAKNVHLVKFIKFSVCFIRSSCKVKFGLFRSFWRLVCTYLNIEHTKKKDHIILDLSKRGDWTMILWTSSHHTNHFAMLLPFILSLIIMSSFSGLVVAVFHYHHRHNFDVSASTHQRKFVALHSWFCEPRGLLATYLRPGKRLSINYIIQF